MLTRDLINSRVPDKKTPVADVLNIDAKVGILMLLLLLLLLLYSYYDFI